MGHRLLKEVAAASGCGRGAACRERESSWVHGRGWVGGQCGLRGRGEGVHTALPY